MHEPREAPGPKGQCWSEFMKDTFGFYGRLKEKYGDVARFKVARTQVFLLSHPDHIKHVFLDNNRNYAKGKSAPRLEAIIGQGLIRSDDELWRKQRKLIQPLFDRKHLIHFFETMKAVAEAGLPALGHKAKASGEVEIFQEMLSLTFQIMSRTLLATDLKDVQGAVARAVTAVLEGSVSREGSLLGLIELTPPLNRLRFLRQLIGGWPTRTNREFRSSIRDLDRIIYSVIRAKRGNMEALKGEKSLLSLLMLARDDENPDGIGERQLRDELITFFLAGHETTATALAWTFHLLSVHSDAEERVRQEVRDVLGGRTPEFDDLDKLSFTRAVFDESLRLYPPAWRLGRYAVGPDEVGGYRIPAGSVVDALPYYVQRDPRWWKDPERFDPDRFMGGEAAERPRFAFFPFGGGPRLCIGHHFATMEALLVIAMMIQRYRFNPVPGHRVEVYPILTLRSRHGIRLRINEA